ncbi:M15 family metallopeptidase [Lutibacter sp.]|uniref:M15 family metallopeptidase n=1 Tax=Lutibacter sp. TaxID=1925666 RepID=UPI003568B69A
MKKKGQLIVISLFFVQLIGVLNSVNYSQSIFSEEDLTGVGELNFESEDIKLQKDVFEAFEEMQKAALIEGISIQIVSGYRSFNRQKEIWNTKFEKYIAEGLSDQQSIEKIIEYSTIPGTSRHHWGTDIDIIDTVVSAPEDMLIEENYINEGIYSNLKTWMDQNSENYGFYLVYDDDIERKGFKYEPWHFSYKLIAKPMLKEFLAIDFVSLLQNNDIAGSYLFSEGFLNKYISEQVLAINFNLK